MVSKSLGAISVTLKHKSRWVITLLGIVIAWLLYEKYGASYAGPPLTGPTGLPSLRQFKRELYPFFVGDQCGYMDTTGRQVLPPTTDGMGWFFDDAAKVTKNGQEGYLLSSGQFQAYPGYRLERISNGWGRASKAQDLLVAILGHESRFTFVDVKGNRISSAWYDDAGDFSEGLARVNRGAGGFRQRVGGEWGYIDTKGREVIPLQFSQVGDFYEGLACVEKGGSWGFIKPSGEFQIAPRYEFAHDFSDGLAAVVIDRKYCYIDTTGAVVIAGPFEWASNFSEGKAAVGDKLAGKNRYIDLRGNAAFPGEFEFAHPFSSGIARVGVHPSAAIYGFLGHHGQWVIQPHGNWTDVSDFVDGYAYVLGTGDAWFIDRQGKRLELKP